MRSARTCALMGWSKRTHRDARTISPAPASAGRALGGSSAAIVAAPKLRKDATHDRPQQAPTQRRPQRAGWPAAQSQHQGRGAAPHWRSRRAPRYQPRCPARGCRRFARRADERRTVPNLPAGRCRRSGRTHRAHRRRSRLHRDSLGRPGARGRVELGAELSHRRRRRRRTVGHRNRRGGQSGNRPRTNPPQRPASIATAPRRRC